MLLIIMSVSMLLPVGVSLLYGDGAQFGLVLSALLSLMLGLLLRRFLGAGAPTQLHEREGVFYTVIIWLVVPLMGALPYLFTSTVTTFADAAFESFSGYTTTGSSVLHDIDSLPQGLLVWRSTSQWVGGMGLILFVVALLQKLNEGSARLYESEFSGTLQRRLHPRLSRSVMLMWAVYLALTVLMFVSLLLVGNGLVDSLCTAMSTVSTGGFMTHDAGFAGFTPLTVSIVTLFMFLSGTNLAVLYYFFTGRWSQLFSRRADGRPVIDEEFVRYVVLFLFAVVITTVSLSRGGLTLATLRTSLFHVASTISTCGFIASTTEEWPLALSVLTFLLMIVGASSGSTGGGIKIKRLMIVARSVRNYFDQIIHPQAVVSVKVDGKAVGEDYVRRVYVFIFLYLAFAMAGAFVYTLCDMSIADALCVAVANISNLGPSPILNGMGTGLDYAALPLAAKWCTMALMLAGRLEIYAFIAVFMPAFWKRR